jgi:hypothetical protein
MTRKNKTLIAKSARSTLHLVLLFNLAAAVPLLAQDVATTNNSGNRQATHQEAVPSNLVQLVRQATQKFVDVNAATAAGYAPFLGCVTGQDHGAMGVHYVNGDVLNAGQINASQPQALIYEPLEGGKMQLVGVEFIVLAAPWLTNNNNTPPVLEGQVFNYVDSPNRFNIPAFFELHVWAWRDNPQGSFVDWNNRVSCAGE